MEEKTVRQTLIEAREVISRPEKWGQGSYHRRGRYCAVGAVMHVRDSNETALQAISLLNKSSPIGVINYNDSHEWADVLALFDRVIARISEDGSTIPWWERRKRRLTLAA